MSENDRVLDLEKRVLLGVCFESIVLRTHSATTDDATHITCHAIRTHGSTLPTHPSIHVHSIDQSHHHSSHLSPEARSIHTHSRGNRDAAPPPRATHFPHDAHHITPHMADARGTPASVAQQLRSLPRQGALLALGHTFTEHICGLAPTTRTTLSHTSHIQNVVLREL